MEAKHGRHPLRRSGRDRRRICRSHAAGGRAYLSCAHAPGRADAKRCRRKSASRRSPPWRLHFEEGKKENRPDYHVVRERIAARARGGGAAGRWRTGGFAAVAPTVLLATSKKT